MQVKEMGNNHFPLLCIEENSEKNEQFTEIEELAFQTRVDILYYLYLKTYDSRGGSKPIVLSNSLCIDSMHEKKRHLHISY